MPKVNFSFLQRCDLETMVSRVLEFILSRSRSRSRDLKSKVEVLISRPEDPGLGLGLKTACFYACSTITVICSNFKRVLCHQLELMQPVLWSRDHGLETRVHFVQVSVSRPDGQGLETWWPRSRSWSRHLKSKA